MSSSEAMMTTMVTSIRDLLRTQYVNETMLEFHSILFNAGIPPPYMDAERLVISIIAGVVTLVLYFVFFGKRHRARRAKLLNDLQQAKKQVNKLQEALENLEEDIDNDKEDDEKEVRIWMDGAFDMMHYGHMNAFRQGKALGTYLIVGVNDDKSITQCKGAPPVMNDEERITSVQGCKFVNEVVEHCPYVMSEDYLNHVIEKYRIDYVVHGDDPCIVDGKDVYATAKALGKYRSIPRTEGVSSSDILGRMLLLNKAHHQYDLENTGSHLSSTMKSQYKRPSKFLTTNRMLRLFSAKNRDPPKEGPHVVYIDGSFDMFHPGHIKMLGLAKEQGNYLIVGVHNDSIVNKHRGYNHPIMNLNERVLSVLGCRYVDDVLIDAPWEVSREMIASLNISVVVQGTQNSDDKAKDTKSHFQIPKELGLYTLLDSPSCLDISDIIERINDNKDRFEAKFKKKMESEQEYYDDRYSHVKEVTLNNSTVEN